MLQVESSPDLRQATIDLCAAAYPDVQPWQVRKQCLPESENIEQVLYLTDLYYTYLTLLLHAIDGHSTAWKDSDLVKVSWDHAWKGYCAFCMNTSSL
jgi:hypothetical protein